MKSILFIIFIIISFSSILTENLRISDIHKRSKYHPHSTTNSTTEVKVKRAGTRGGAPTFTNTAKPKPNSQPFRKRGYLVNKHKN